MLRATELDFGAFLATVIIYIFIHHKGRKNSDTIKVN